jgi:hypothetical protein
LENVIAKVSANFGLAIGKRPAAPDNSGTTALLSATLEGAEWAAIAAWSLLRATFATGCPLENKDQLSFSMAEESGEGILFLDVNRGDGRRIVHLELIRGVTSSKFDPIPIGMPWYPVASVANAGVLRWAAPDNLQGCIYGSAAFFSPCLLLPIGDDALALTKNIQRLVADVVEIDDRPVIGGGLPDFWQSNLARVIGACLRNPNIRSIIAIGDAARAKQTLARLRMSEQQWNAQLSDLQRRLSISVDYLQVFRDRKVEVEQVDASADAILSSVARATIAIPADEPQLPLHIPTVKCRVRFIDLRAEARQRRLPPAVPAELNRLLATDGLRAKTLADAYPQAIQLLRTSEAPAQQELTNRRFREFSSFKLVLTDPFRDEIPDYWAGEDASLEGYYNRNFEGVNSLFGGRLLTAPPEGVTPAREHALNAITEALHLGRPTRRVILQITPRPDELDQPLGLCAIHVMPRFRQDRWHLDFQWVWRTVEALVGFPFSAFGSIRWSGQFFDEARQLLTRRGNSKPVERGELTYIGLSFHIFLDSGDLEIARAIVLDASR